ncbi:MAG: transposase [Bryobacteraceae bacterium]
MLHPHVHCVIPAGGLSADHRSWIHPRYPFFSPVKALRAVFSAASLSPASSACTDAEN